MFASEEDQTMPSHRYDRRDRVEADDERRERVLQQWFANDSGPIEPEAAGVVFEAEAVQQEALDFAETVRAEAAALATGVPATTPADEPEVSLEDLLTASQVLLDMCQALLEDTALSANQRQTVENIAEVMKTAPDSIRRTIADAEASAGTAPGTAGTAPGDDARPAPPFNP
jgi:hypothetical protein